MQRTTALAGLAAGALMLAGGFGLTPASASTSIGIGAGIPAAPVTRAESLELNVFRTITDALVEPTVKTDAALTSGEWYRVRVKGTMSYWSKGVWQHPRTPWNMICGTPEAAPQYPSQNRQNGPTGQDAETLFARPWTASRCAKTSLPRHRPALVMSTSGIFGFRHYEPVGGAAQTPSADHAYTYFLQGEGKRGQFRLRDFITGDNYGVFRIAVNPAIAADCAGAGWEAFGTFADQASCEQALAPIG
jgi:hypothetical protein